jgi:hypothetical protein
LNNSTQQILVNLDETKEKYSLDKMKVGGEDWIHLWNKCLMIYQTLSRYWGPQLETGKECMNYMRRKIFTSGQIQKMINVDGKYPIQPQEMKGPINTLLRMIVRNVQSSVMTTEDSTPPENAASAEDFNVVLKKVSDDVGIEDKKKKALRRALITAYPQWVWFGIKEPLSGLPSELESSLLPWPQTLCSPHFENPDGSDITEVVRIAPKTKSALLTEYPDRKKAREEFDKMLEQDEGFKDSLLMVDNENTSDDRSELVYDQLTATTFDSNNGYYLVAERVFQVKKKQTLYINEQTGDVQMLPENWDKKRKQNWIDSHTDYNIRKNNHDVVTLWVTTIDTTGFIWENSQHWFQEDGRLPGLPLIVDMIDGIPEGAGPDMLPLIKSIAVADTEALHEVRTGTGDITVFMQGSLRKPASLHKQLSSSHGEIEISKRAKAGMDSIKQWNRKPNDTYFKYGDLERDRLKQTHGINDANLGKTHPRQSFKAKNKESEEGIGPQFEYTINYSKFNLDIANLIIMMIPYFMNEHQIIEIKDEYGKTTGKLEVNEPQFNTDGTVAEIMANDLTSAKYRLVPVAAEDTPTSRAHDLQEFTEMIKGIGNTLFQMDPKLFGRILFSFPNKFAKEAGQFMLEQADGIQQAQQSQVQAEQALEAQIEKGRRDVDWAKLSVPKSTFNFDPQGIEDAPQGAQIMMNYYNQLAANSKAQAAPQQAPAQPELQAQPQI